MTDHSDIEELIDSHRRHLKVLEKQQAMYGLATPPHILLGIEDALAKIAELEAQLGRGAPAEAQSNCRACRTSSAARTSWRRSMRRWRPRRAAGAC